MMGFPPHIGAVYALFLFLVLSVAPRQLRGNDFFVAADGGSSSRPSLSPTNWCELKEQMQSMLQDKNGKQSSIEKRRARVVLMRQWFETLSGRDAELLREQCGKSFYKSPNGTEMSAQVTDGKHFSTALLCKLLWGAEFTSTGGSSSASTALAQFFLAMSTLQQRHTGTFSSEVCTSRKQERSINKKEKEEIVVVQTHTGWQYLGPFTFGKTELDGDVFVPPCTASTTPGSTTAPRGDIPPSSSGTPLDDDDDTCVACNLNPFIRDSERRMRYYALLKGAKKNPMSKREKRVLFPFISESVSGGFIDWTVLPSRGRGATTTTIARSGEHLSAHLAFEHTELQHLIQDLGTMAAMEFVGYAVQDYLVLKPNVNVVVRVRGVHTVFYSIHPLIRQTRKSRCPSLEAIAGDIYGRHGSFSFKVPALSLLRIYLRVRGVAQSQVEFDLSPNVPSSAPMQQKAVAVSWEVAKPLYLPDIVRGRLFGLPTEKTMVTTAAIAIPVSLHSLEGVGDSGPAQNFLRVRSVKATVVGPSSIAKQIKFCVDAECGSDTLPKITEATAQTLFDDDPLLADYLNRRGGRITRQQVPEATRRIHVGQTMPVSFQLGIVDPEAAQSYCSSKRKGEAEVTVAFTVSVSLLPSESEIKGDEDDVMPILAEQQTTVNIRCRDFLTQSFASTFQAADGGVAIVAVRAPVTTTGTSLSSCVPIVLSLHGTGVEATNQADSYKRKATPQEKKQKLAHDGYVFGVDGAWLAAADRHGAHNWESVGRITAMTALFHITAVSLWPSLWQQVPTANSLRVLFAGHSMGGHGALHLASLYPSRAIGAAFIASWLNKEHYGEANAIWKLDRSTSHVPAKLKALLESSISGTTPDYVLSSALKDIPIFIRVGSKDRTVSPFFSRRLHRLLLEAGNTDVTYDEVKDQEHWWWDTKSPNDGGCVNDDRVRKFFQRILGKAGDKCINGSPRTPTATFEIVTTNPAAMSSPLPGRHCYEQGGRHHRVCISAQRQPHQPSVVRGKLLNCEGNDEQRGSTCVLSLQTENVRCLTARASFSQLTVDGDSGIVIDHSKEHRELCYVDGVGWCWAETHLHMNPLSPTSMRQYSEGGPMTVLLPGLCGDSDDYSSSSDDDCPLLRSLGKYFANHHWVAYETPVAMAYDAPEGPGWLMNHGSQHPSPSSSAPTSTTTAASTGNTIQLLTGRSIGTQVMTNDTRHEEQCVKLYRSSVSVVSQSAPTEVTVCQNGTTATIRVGSTIQIHGRHLAIAMVSNSNDVPLLMMDVDGEGQPSSIRSTGSCGTVLTLFGTTHLALEHLMYNIGQPTVPPMMRVPFSNLLPSIIVANAARAHQGAGSIEFAGVWNRDGTGFADCFARSGDRC